MDRAWVPADNGPGEKLRQVAMIVGYSHPKIVVPHRRRHRRILIMREARGVSPNWFNFYKLNAHGRPGLTAQEFFDLFTHCRCGLIMTRTAFTRHYCKFTVIDLTVDEDDGDVVDLTLGERGP